MACVKWLKPINTNKEVEAPLSPATRLFHSPQLNCCIVALFGCKTVIDVEVVKEGLYQTFVKHPRISSKLVFFYFNNAGCVDVAFLHRSMKVKVHFHWVFDPKKPGVPVGWIRTKVDLDNHILVPSLNPNMDSPDEFVEDYVSNLAQTPMDFTKPLWEIHILNIKTKDANAIALFRVHHSVGDGISLMSLVLACTRKSSDPNAVPTLPTENKKKKKLLDTSSSRSLWVCFLWLTFAFKMFWNTIIDLCLFLATVVFLEDTKTPVKGSAGTEKAPKKFVYKNLSFDDIKLVKNFMDVTINDVILGITQAGISRYLNRKYGESNGDEKVQQNKLPQHIRLRSTLLVNIRPTSRLENLAEQMEADDLKTRKWEWGNSIGYILLPFHIVLRDDPLDYIRRAKATIDKKKHSLEAIATYLSAKFVLKTLGLGVAGGITYRVIKNTTLSFSNVVGPMEEISFYGHPLTLIAPSVYGHPQALTVHFQSYMDMMTLVVAVSQNVIPEPHQLCDDIAESLELVKQAVQKK